VKPAGGAAGEDCSRGETAPGGGKDNVGVIGNRAQCVKAATEAAPARTKEVILGQPMAPRLLEIEWTRGERCWN
jgi:hypothetical protein